MDNRHQLVDILDQKDNRENTVQEKNKKRKHDDDENDVINKKPRLIVKEGEYTCYNCKKTIIAIDSFEDEENNEYYIEDDHGKQCSFNDCNNIFCGDCCFYQSSASYRCGDPRYGGGCLKWLCDKHYSPYFLLGEDRPMMCPHCTDIESLIEDGDEINTYTLIQILRSDIGLTEEILKDIMMQHWSSTKPTSDKIQKKWKIVKIKK